jgi:hypothetical protein
MTIVSKPASKAYRDNYPFPDKRDVLTREEFEAHCKEAGVALYAVPTPTGEPLRSGAIADIVKLWLKTSGFERVCFHPTSSRAIVLVDDLPLLAEYIQNALRL